MLSVAGCTDVELSNEEAQTEVVKSRWLRLRLQKRRSGRRRIIRMQHRITRAAAAVLRALRFSLFAT